MKKREATVLLFAFFALLVVGGLLIAVAPAPRFSARENRLLAPFPTPTRQTLANGEFFASIDTFATERAPFRAPSRALYSGIERLLCGKAHGVLLCRDGSLSATVEVSEGQSARNRAALSRLENSLGALPFTAAVAPIRGAARAEVLPRYYHFPQRELPAHVITFPHLTRDEEWFRTDHHWTATGAFAAYRHLAPALGITPYAEEEFEKQTVSENFLGTSEARAGLWQIAPDRLTLWRFAGDETLSLFREGEPTAFSGLYDFEKLQTRDQFSVFLGGNASHIEIRAGEDDARPTLLVIRDSFASPLLPFLARHFRVVAIDPRYGTHDLAALAADADRVLLLCGEQTLLSEPFLTLLLRGI